MPVQARRLIRKMRGGAQAQLLEAADGHFYVVKFINNPQHRRILVNEWIASAFLSFLNISTPEVAMIEVSEGFLRENPDAYFQLGSRRQELIPGWHFGSRFPGDPARNAVHDFLPDSLLDTVENVAEFCGVLAFDKWMGNADSRQAIFFRARLMEAAGAGIPGRPKPSAQPLGLVASMVDNGFAFDGPHWNFTDSPIQGLYFRPIVYRDVRGLDSFQPWLDRIVHFPEEVIDQAIKQIPPAWLEGEEDALDQLLNRLLARRRRVPDLIEASCTGRVNPFPRWV